VQKERLLPIVRNLMEEKNSALMAGDIPRLERIYYRDPISEKALEKEKNNIVARLRSEWVRRIKYRGHSTKVNLGTIVRTDEILNVKVNEMVTWWYQEGERFGFERRQRSHRLSLVPGSRWLIKDDQYRQEPFVATIPRPMVPLKKGGSEKKLDGFISRGYSYDRIAAVRYAHKWWNGHNPNFRAFSVDCTNYVSQVLYAGGIPMTYTGRQNSGWWYQGDGGENDKWSYSWAVAHSLRWFLASGKGRPRAESVQYASQLQPGDVICYDWDGDGVWQHNAVVVDYNTEGQPLINAHTTNSQYRYWDYRDSPAWSKNTRYLFWKILG